MSNTEICRVVNDKKDYMKGWIIVHVDMPCCQTFSCLENMVLEASRRVQHDLEDVRDSFGNPNRSRLETAMKIRKIARNDGAKEMKTEDYCFK